MIFHRENVPMVDPVPHPNWTPPPNAPASRPSAWQSNQGDVFESALKRADSSRSSDEDDESTIDEPESEAKDAEAPLSGQTKAHNSAARESAARSPLDELKHRTRSLELDSSDKEINLQSTASSVGVSSESVRSTENVATTAAQAPLMVETVAAMMMRLDRMPEANAGQWRFNVLNDPAGISSVQLQRVANGGWRVNVSLNPGSEVDQEQQTSELKTALEMHGHEVESVQLTSAQFDAELNES